MKSEIDYGKTELPIMLKIDKIIDEAKDVKTFYFKHNLGAKPGQFVNIWIPGLDEKPMSISFQDKDSFGVTVQGVGPFSKAMLKLKKGAQVGIRGPYGSGFTVKGKKVVIVGGGCGCAPTAFLADFLSDMAPIDDMPDEKDIHYISAAKSKENVLFEKRMKGKMIEFHAATEDGSLGFKGYATDLLEELFKEHKFDMIYTCGPEIMMVKVVEIAEKYNVDCEVSLERYMKCGIGICGNCCLDDGGERVCKEGPVFDKEKVKKLAEFGKYHRDATGKKVSL